MIQTDDWQSRIRRGNYIDSLSTLGAEKLVREKKLPAGSIVFSRRRRRKLRTHYVVLKVTDWGGTETTNAEIVYSKSKRKWNILLDGKPVNEGYTTCKGAKSACMPHPLDRLAAEIDATA
jgi:hypothetical protein